MHRDYCIIRDKNLIQEEQNGFHHMSKKSVGTAGTRVSEDGLRNLLPNLSSPKKRLQSQSALPLEVVKECLVPRFPPVSSATSRKQVLSSQFLKKHPRAVSGWPV